MAVLAHDPYVAEGQNHDVTLVGLGRLMAESDFVSLHAPLTPQTRGMVDGPLLAQMKPGAALINTARGELIDEDALVRALDDGPLRAAALDVLAQEPPGPSHPFLRREDVLVTPHMGPHTAEATSAMGAAALDDLLAVLSGRAPRYPL
jgi:D-3-phosphoglycerate dehydrogenase